eukprot:jgi/Psemu1/17876/gm1.17876_g
MVLRSHPDVILIQQYPLKVGSDLQLDLVSSFAQPLALPPIHLPSTLYGEPNILRGANFLVGATLALVNHMPPLRKEGLLLSLLRLRAVAEEVLGGGTIKMDTATNLALEHFYKPELRQSLPSPKPIQTPVFRAAQPHGTYFKCEDENERVTRVSQLDVFQHSDSSLGTNGNNNNNENARGGQDPLAFAIQRKREQRKKLVTKATKKMFPSLSKGMVTISNKVNKGHLCLKWHSATKAQRAQELVKRIDAGYEKIEEADLLNTLDWLVAPVHDCLGCYNTKCNF